MAAAVFGGGMLKLECETTPPSSSGRQGIELMGLARVLLRSVAMWSSPLHNKVSKFFAKHVLCLRWATVDNELDPEGVIVVGATLRPRDEQFEGQLGGSTFLSRRGLRNTANKKLRIMLLGPSMHQQMQRHHQRLH